MIRRARKLARKKAQREGLIPPDVRKVKLLDAREARATSCVPAVSVILKRVPLRDQ